MADVNSSVPKDAALPLSSGPALLLEHPYLPVESGYALLPDGIYHIAASTYMPGCSAAMSEWWFGFIKNTEQYKLWHPRDHVFSDWEIGPEAKARGVTISNNDGKYIGGHHLVHEFIGGVLAKLRISLVSPSVYFGEGWEAKFQEKGYGAAICARVGSFLGGPPVERWLQGEQGTELSDEEKKIMEMQPTEEVYGGHLIHLIKDEPDGCRMRSRFWLGDVEGVTDPAVRTRSVPPFLPAGFCKHATEEMAILARQLPELYHKHTGKV